MRPGEAGGGTAAKDRPRSLSSVGLRPPVDNFHRSDHDWSMPETSSPDRSQLPPPDAIDRPSPSTSSALPVGSPATARVIGRQPFGVFLLLDGVPNAIGL